MSYRFGGISGKRAVGGAGSVLGTSVGKEFSTPTHPSGDTFKGETLNTDWTENLDTYVSAHVKYGQYSCYSVSGGVTGPHAADISRTITGFASGQSVIAAGRIVGDTSGGEISMALEIRNGTDAFGVRMYQTAGTVYLQSFKFISSTFTNHYLHSWADDTLMTQSPIWLRAEWTAVNSFNAYWSLDGEGWIPQGAPGNEGPWSTTLTPDTVALRSNSQDAAGPWYGSWNFVDII